MIMPKMPSAEALETIKMSINDMTDEDLAELICVARGQRLYRDDQKRYTFRIGAMYKFTDKHGNMVVAELVKIAPKNCKLIQAIKDSNGFTVRRMNWTVHPSFITCA